MLIDVKKRSVNAPLYIYVNVYMFKAMFGDKRDSMTSGINSTMSGMSSVFNGNNTVIFENDSASGSIVTNAPTESISELFFDPRLK
jgi:hypothetical protein